MLVELKNGDTYNGHLVNCDTWMNVNLREVICTSKDGDRFWKMPECYIRGNTIKYIRVPNETVKPIVDVDEEDEGLSETEEDAEDAEVAVKEVAVKEVAGKEVAECVGEVEVELADVDVVAARNSVQESIHKQNQPTASRGCSYFATSSFAAMYSFLPSIAFRF
ncbi:hypothetical protein CCR75_002204 [Bremia lactucae]|uniref:U6 snRNA-associated Sm-like protein LSm4 n=1 Tax=Bremia lactucae TaxID=4779 RepID=A0A976IFR9_BRELC|nr:hypothetical protein CCR75_002204 [Bremia lactucae]